MLAMDQVVDKLMEASNHIPAQVSILPAPAGSVHASVNQAMEAAGWRRFITRGADVALKVNLGWDVFLPGAVSAPWVVEGVIQTIRDYVGRIYVVESNQVVVDAEKALHQTGLDEVCRRHRVEWVNMSNGDFVEVTDDSRLVLKRIHIPEILTRTELITIPLMKTHNKTVITGAIKNQWGCLQELRHNFHLVLSEALVDVNSIIKPRFAVMDATIGLEENGPKSGKPKEVGLVLASGDLVALDTVAARIMGFDPLNIHHIQLCFQHGLGTANFTQIQVVGERIEDVLTPFIPARHNAVSWLELMLRRSSIRWLVFDTPLLNLFCWGARRYYDLWEILVGKKLRTMILKNSPYAAQWVQ
jgi:uncharacterized protein (DUF362 family)